ncbi:hypothetical protein [Ramlibacter rhizophilus]|uniref:Virulence factor n=1 Tax=Ramlibacter rhizophilus TaxID=1781167 RepID=A0A4Z0BEX0_9BURK|nr:hypothetical protein [Ramlibacter rhizophilus]TFY96929.1 hypothetical protein EZ242_19880 [Ramlibacter rhizophilus]
MRPTSLHRGLRLAGAAIALIVAGAAQARDRVYWSVDMSPAPGVSVAVGNVRPHVVHPAPIYVQPAPVYVQPPAYVQPSPVYVRPAPVYVRPAPVFVQPHPVFSPPPVIYAPPPVIYAPHGSHLRPPVFGANYGRPIHHWKPSHPGKHPHGHGHRGRARH